MEVWPCYSPLLLAGLNTVEKDEDSFVGTDEAVTAIVSRNEFEILGEFSELPAGQHTAWMILRREVVSIFVAFQTWPKKYAFEKHRSNRQ